METTKLRSLATVSLLWLTLGVGCQKDPPDLSCKDGSCCSPGSPAVFLKRIEGVRVEYDSFIFAFKEALSVHYRGNEYKCWGGPVCDGQEVEVASMRLKSNTTIENGRVRLIDSTHAYSYRLWGALYELPNESRPFNSPLRYTIRVEKVEEVK